jgi:hypothetical protein
MTNTPWSRENKAPAGIANTRRNVNSDAVVRLGGIVSERTRFRHTLHSAAVPAIAFYSIKQKGLRVSRNPVQAQWGDGAYVWAADAPMGGIPYVDVVALPGTLIEELHVKGQKPFYRLLPPTGDYVRVEAEGTNISDDVLEAFRDFANK